MKTFTTQLLSLALLATVPGLAAAQEDTDELGVTMSVVEDEEAADEQHFVNEIQLPDVAAEEAHSNAQEGIETANQARQQGSENADERAQEGFDRRPEGGNGGNGGDQAPSVPSIP